MKKNINNLFFLLLIFIILFLAPRVFGVFSTYYIFVGFGITVMFAVSLNLLANCGLYSLGHALFFGTGAYATALGLLHIEGLSILSALLLGGLASGMMGLLLSPLLLRVSGVYFTLLTMALNQIVYTSCLKFSEVTSGENGLSSYLVPPLYIPGFGSFDMGKKITFYYFAILLIAFCICVMWFVTKTPFGGIMVSIRENHERVTYLGFQVPITKTIIFVISGFFAGISGSIFALWLNLVDPSSTLHMVNVSIVTFLAILVGGLGTFIGPFIGVGILALFDELTFVYGRPADMAILFITILYLLYAPRHTPWGIMGVYSKIRQRIRETRSPGHNVVIGG